MRSRQLRMGSGGMVTRQGLYAYLYCMMASSILVAMPIFGGALFMCGQVAMVFFTTYTGAARAFLPKGARRWQTALLAFLLLVNLCLVVLYPISVESPRMWILFVLVLMMMLQETVNHQLMRLSLRGAMKNRTFLGLMGVSQLALLLVMTVTFLYNVRGPEGWWMLGGYVLCSVMACYDVLKERAAWQVMPRPNAANAERTGEIVRKASAFQRYERLSTLILVAQEMTLIVIYTFLAVTAEQMLWSLVIAVATMLLCREAVEAFLRWREKGRPADPTNLLIVGLFLWLYGLMFFSRSLDRAMGLTQVYICLGLCTGGAALCMTCLRRMDPAMAQVARFAAREDNTEDYHWMLVAQRTLAVLLGEMLALAALTVLCFYTGKDLPRDIAQIAERFQPIMVLPALLTVLAALLCVMRFPLTSRWMNKLSRFLHLREEGGENPALEKQLESVVVKRMKRPLGTRIILAMIRPFFRHTLKGVENIRQDDNNPLVFLCNHGEVYGPVVCMLYIPVAIRPWVMSELTIHKDEVAAYVHRYTISKMTWLGPLRWPAAKLVGVLSVWAMNQLESIPVFRNKPRELMQTFRRSVEAMQAGDNLLIFPENPNADQDHPGYEHAEGSLGELFRGYAMLAQVYYNRTGKCCRFLPMYAHRGLRTLSFGTEIVYNPDNEPIVERDRLVDGAYAQMQAMAAREEALYQSQLRGSRP